MSVRIGKEADGRVSVTLKAGSQSQAVAITPVEARLLAIKLLLASENLTKTSTADD